MRRPRTRAAAAVGAGLMVVAWTVVVRSVSDMVVRASGVCMHHHRPIGEMRVELIARRVRG